MAAGLFKTHCNRFNKGAKMKKLFLSLLCAGLMSMALPAPSQAEELDMGKITCEDLMKMDEKEKMLMIFWFDGYLSQKKNDTRIDQEWIQKLSQHVAEFCTQNPGKPAIESLSK